MPVPHALPPAHVHAPLTQVSPGPHALPHAPQLLGSEPVLLHWAVQVPLTQTSPALHALEHEPQFAGSLAKVVEFSHARSPPPTEQLL
jgi:hypothetical protein